MRKQLKIAAVAALLAVGFTANAQTVEPTAGDNSKDITKQAKAELGKNGGSIRVIDNKGTKKYLQVNNGLTIFTDKDPQGGIVTTWQLGGTLTENTYIQADSGKEFALDGLELITDVTANPASTNAGDRTSHDDTSIGGGSGTGFTVLIRDENSGAIQKIMLTDLLQVQEDYGEVTVSASNINDLKDATATATTGIPIAFEVSPRKVQLYRNGAKLKADVDYKVKTVAGSGGVADQYFVYLIENSVEPNDWILMVDDQIEFHAIK